LNTINRRGTAPFKPVHENFYRLTDENGMSQLMSAKVTPTIAVFSKELGSAIEALSSAGQAFRSTRFQWLSYHALMLSADVVVASFIALVVVVGISMGKDSLAAQLIIKIFTMSLLVGLVSLLLNIPLLLKALRERSRLKKLGLNSLYTSLWMENRRSRWISRARGALLTVAGFIALSMTALSVVRLPIASTSERNLVLSLALITFVLLGARYLRIQRERMELTASAEELRKALQSLQRHAGKVVYVPSELLEQTAKIETAQIAEQSINLRSSASPARR
jgi:hypothetical protein